MAQFRLHRSRPLSVVAHCRCRRGCCCGLRRWNGAGGAQVEVLGLLEDQLLQPLPWQVVKFHLKREGLFTDRLK